MMTRDTFRVIVAGSRSFNDYATLQMVCDNLLAKKKQTHNIVVISGTARGADTLGEQYAHERGYAVEEFPADWQQYGKAAGPIRNRQIADIADAVIAFWDGHSTGTKDMITEAKKKGLAVRIYNI
jgi:predicted Rossmann fold nucleotide-binding protein DprA/Smf involved in DNA uptake